MCLYGSLFSSSPSYTVAGCSEWQCRCTAFGCSPLPPFLSSFAGSYTPAYQGRGPHPHRWILVEGSIYPLGYLWAALLVLFATGRSATKIVPPHTFFKPSLGLMLRGKLVARPTGLNGSGLQLRQHGWVWFANGFWLFPPATLVHPRLPISTFTKATHMGN